MNYDFALNSYLLKKCSYTHYVMSIVNRIENYLIKRENSNFLG